MCAVTGSPVKIRHAPGVRHARHPCAGYAMRGGCARARGGGYAMRQLCARARVRARIVARVCRAGAAGMPWACHARRIVAGFAGHGGEFAGARGAWHGGDILGAWRGILARGVAWKMIRGAGAETAQTVDF